MEVRRRGPTPWALVALATGLGAPTLARSATLTVTDALISRAECVDRFRETGIRHTCLTFDATKAVVDDFGSARSWDLSTVGWALAGGFAFTF